MNNPLTHRQRRRIMTGELMNLTRARARAFKARREMSDKEENFSQTTIRLLTDHYSPLSAYSVLHKTPVGALTAYIEHLEGRANAYIDGVTDMTGMGFFHFNDWFATIFQGASNMIAAEREESRLHQSVYANRQVAQTVKNMTLQNIRFSDFNERKEAK